MTRERKTIIAIAACLALLLSLPLGAIGILLYVRATREAAPPPERGGADPTPKSGDVIPPTYWVIGPFGPGRDKSYEPEKNPDPTRPCKTPAGTELQWHVQPIIAGAFCLDFRRAFKQKNTDDMAAYALVYIHSPKDQAGELLLGSDDTITVWLNGMQVHQHLRPRSGVQDDDRALVAWKQGCNTLLIRVGNKTGDHLFFAKLRSPLGLRASTSKELPEGKGISNIESDTKP